MILLMDELVQHLVRDIFDFLTADLMGEPSQNVLFLRQVTWSEDNTFPTFCHLQPKKKYEPS